MIEAAITFALLGLFMAGIAWGDSSTKWAPLFFIDGLSMVLLLVFWAMKLLYLVAGI